jgi:hypothetical protein
MLAMTVLFSIVLAATASFVAAQILRPSVGQPVRVELRRITRTRK